MNKKAWELFKALFLCWGSLFWVACSGTQADSVVETTAPTSIEQVASPETLGSTGDTNGQPTSAQSANLPIEPAGILNAPLSVEAFSAEHSIVYQNQPNTLSWVVTNATNVEVFQVDANGQKTLLGSGAGIDSIVVNTDEIFSVPPLVDGFYKYAIRGSNGLGEFVEFNTRVLYKDSPNPNLEAVATDTNLLEESEQVQADATQDRPLAITNFQVDSNDIEVGSSLNVDVDASWAFEVNIHVVTATGEVISIVNDAANRQNGSMLNEAISESYTIDWTQLTENETKALGERFTLVAVASGEAENSVESRQIISVTQNTRVVAQPTIDVEQSIRPIIEDFSAEKWIVGEGEDNSVKWATTGADSVELYMIDESGGWILLYEGLPTDSFSWVEGSFFPVPPNVDGHNQYILQASNEAGGFAEHRILIKYNATQTASTSSENDSTLQINNFTLSENRLRLVGMGGNVSTEISWDVAGAAFIQICTLDSSPALCSPLHRTTENKGSFTLHMNELPLFMIDSYGVSSFPIFIRAFKDANANVFSPDENEFIESETLTIIHDRVTQIVGFEVSPTSIRTGDSISVTLVGSWTYGMQVYLQTEAGRVFNLAADLFESGRPVPRQIVTQTYTFDWAQLTQNGTIDLGSRFTIISEIGNERMFQSVSLTQ